MIVKPAVSTNAISNNYNMPSAGDSWSTIIQKKTMGSDHHLVRLAETPPTIDAKTLWNENWTQDSPSDMEPSTSQEISGDKTVSRGRIPEGPDVVKEKRCMIYSLPPELIGQILAKLEQGDIMNFRWASRQSACHGLQYLFKKGKARLSLCREIGYGIDTLTKKNVSWRIKDLEVYGDMKEESLEIVENPDLILFFDKTMFWKWDSVHTLHNIRRLELRLQPRLDIPVYIRLAASNLMFRFLVHLLIEHRSPIVNLRIVHVGWWIRYEEGTTLMKAISNFKSFELLGDLGSPDYYGDILSCLQSMTELRNLVIDFGTTSVNAPWDISYICELTFDHLRSVRFSNLSASQQKFLQFFEHHTELQDVHIGTMLLANGSWTQSIHAMSRILPGLKNIKFSGLQIFSRSEGVYEEGYICSNSLNAYIKKFTWPIVGLERRARERRVTVEMICQERSIRKKKAAAENLCAGDICGTCGFLQEFCTRLT